MSIHGITNLNQYSATQYAQTQIKKQVSAGQTAKPQPVPSTTVSDDNAVTLDISERKTLAKGPLDEAELQRRQEERDAMRNLDLKDVFKSGTPNSAEVEANKKVAAQYAPIQAKMLSGKPLTAEEKSFLQEHYPDAYSMAMRIEEEIRMLKEQLSNCKSKGDADKLFLEKKMQAIGTGKKDNFALFMVPALDEAYRSL